ncbi:MAG: NAD(P)-binding protein [Actinomycetota bacterium]|nr:NAD(P)-binding protein [Actinomycetota bacterium]
MNERNIALRRALIKAVVAIGVVIAVTTAALSLREGIFLPRAFMLVVLMLGGNHSLLDLESRQTDTQVMVTIISLVRILIMALAAATILDFILRQRLPMLYSRRSKRMQNHVILCGLGQVGYRVSQELQRFDTEVTVVELDPSGPFVSTVTHEGIPILFEDARRTEVLIKAGLERASAVIACTDNDLTNVEIALDAREVRPDIRVVLRLFDQGMASKIVKSFDIEAAFSSAALAAPAFAAAAVDPSVRDSFYVGEVLFVHSTFWVPEGSSLTHLSVWDIWGKYDVNTLTFTDSAGAVAWHPGPTVHVPPGSKITVVGPYEQVQYLQSEHGIIDRAARVKHASARARKEDDSASPPA